MIRRPPRSTLFLHDALPILVKAIRETGRIPVQRGTFYEPIKVWETAPVVERDRKSTRLNSSHLGISYAVFCLKKKKKKNEIQNTKKTKLKNARDKLIREHTT